MRGTRRWMTALALLGLVLVLVLGLWQHRQGTLTGPGSAALAPHVPRAGAAASASDPAVPPPLAASTRPASDTGTGSAGLSPRALRMRADWCGYGATEAAKDEQAGRDLDSDASERLDAMRVLRWAQQQQRARWVRRLTERGDQRSLAIAAFLDEAFPRLPPADPGSRARLQDLARRSTDPLVTSLALQRPCPPGQCSNIEATQWSRLEPDNVLAWMAQWGSRKLPPHRQAELLAQIASQARRAESHNEALLRVLRSLPAAVEPGLAHQAESMLLFDFSADQGAGLLSLASACSRNTGQPALRQSCLGIAEMLWQHDDLYLRGLAADMGQALQPGTELWAARALQRDAVRRARADVEQKELEELKALDERMGSSLCPSLPALRTWLERRFDANEWQEGLDLVQGSGLDARAWLVRWHDAHPDVARPDSLAHAASR
ncbi:MAG TPA: hypothetical protein VK195_06555 [Burkholderiaceae bacterium]|nr:hypothetical protein [Burkholderiaceae bacterium]